MARDTNIHDFIYACVCVRLCMGGDRERNRDRKMTSIKMIAGGLWWGKGSTKYSSRGQQALFLDLSTSYTGGWLYPTCYAVPRFHNLFIMKSGQFSTGSPLATTQMMFFLISLLSLIIAYTTLEFFSIS